MPAPQPTNLPIPLTSGLLSGLASSRPIFLFLDYDGTISEINPIPANATPVSGAREIIQRISAHRDRIRVAIVSGREIDEVQRLSLLQDNLMFVGAHGLEIMEGNGQRWIVTDVKEFMPDLTAVREWLRETVPPNSGFIVEDKHIAIALHYRNAPPELIAKLRQDLENFVSSNTRLAMRSGKMVLEVIPPEAGKGFAVSFLLQRAEGDPIPVYFGDDTTDEDAFFALRRNGITVLVSPNPRPTWARYYVQNPTQVIEALSELLLELEPEPATPAN